MCAALIIVEIKDVFNLKYLRPENADFGWLEAKTGKYCQSLPYFPILPIHF